MQDLRLVLRGHRARVRGEIQPDRPANRLNFVALTLHLATYLLALHRLDPRGQLALSQLAVGSAHQTVKAFRDEGLRFPSRLRAPAAGVIFHPLTASAAMRTLRNPRYAGTYACGQRVYRRTANGGKTFRNRACNDWLACIPGAHPGYITWDRYQENLHLLESNGHGYDAARGSPPREGVALLQGRAVCGRCGQHLRVRYREQRGKLEAWYVCDRASDARAEPNCQSLAGPPIDEAVGRGTGPFRPEPGSEAPRAPPT